MLGEQPRESVAAALVALDRPLSLREELADSLALAIAMAIAMASDGRLVGWFGSVRFNGSVSVSSHATCLPACLQPPA